MIMNERYTPLSNVCTFSDQRIPVRHLSLESYISTENMLPEKGGIEIASSLPSVKTVPKYNVNDILISNIRPYYKKIWFANKIGGCSNDVLVLRTNNEFIPKFVYYVLSDNNFFNYDTLTSKGTKMPRGTPTAIMKYLVPKLTLTEQQKIASILSSYDDLIENNKRRIKILEQIADNLYKEWFVRFRFPGYKNCEFENGIPKNWQIKRIKDFGKVKTGKTPSTSKSEYYDGDILFVKTPDMHNKIFVINTDETLSTTGNNSQKKCLLPPKSIMVSCIGTGGVVSINASPAHTNQQINSIVLYNKQDLEWLYFCLKSMKETIIMFGNTGSTMTNLSKGKFEKIKILYPNQQLISKFNNVVAPILNQILELSKLNKNLITQRDLLLPRLMSGKLEVTNENN